MVSGRIVPFRFYPFFMIMVPAPSCPAAAFIPLISGDTAAALPGANNGVSAPGANRFLFQDQERQFLEILYFLGAVWFRTLLVNSRQQADTVYAEVGRLLRHMDIEKGCHALEIEPSEPLGVFAGSQIFWVPDQRILADNWKGYWKQAMHMGFELVDAGLKTGVAWDHGQFRLALDALRNQIRDDMFSGPAIASVGKEKTTASEKISTVPQGILQKWQADSARAGGQSSLEVESEYPDMDETVILSSAMKKPVYPSDIGPPTAADLHTMDKPGMPPDASLPRNDDDLAATDDPGNDPRSRRPRHQAGLMGASEAIIRNCYQRQQQPPGAPPKRDNPSVRHRARMTRMVSWSRPSLSDPT